MIPYGHQWIDSDDVNSVVKALTSDWLTTGPLVEEFERQLCSYTGGKHAVVVNSGTSALDIAVQALGIPQGSEVITTPFTFAATNNSLLYNGLVPVFADITMETRNIDPDSIRQRITPKTKAIMCVDFAGHPCDINEIREIAQDHDLFLIEDACHALGASYHGKKLGTFADVNVFSFHPVKPITTGEGGAAITDNPDLASRMRLLRNHGIEKGTGLRKQQDLAWKYDMITLGRNYRMTDLQAALGISQIKKLDRFIQKRNYLAETYKEMLSNVSFIDLPITKNNIIHGWHLFTILVKGVNRNTFFGYMRNKGIGVNVHYIPTYRLSYYTKNIPTDFTKCPVAEKVFRHIVTLPLYPSMNENDLGMVVDMIKKFEHR